MSNRAWLFLLVGTAALIFSAGIVAVVVAAG
jgi:hypothetical protein